MGNSALLSGDGWMSIVAEVPVIMGNNGNITSAPQRVQPAPIPTSTSITGCDQELLGMCVGEKPKLKIHAKMGYGECGSPPKIPGDYDLLGRTNDQIRTTKEVNATMAACNALYLDGLVIVGGTGYSLKDINEAKPDKTEHGFEKSAKNQGQRLDGALVFSSRKKHNKHKLKLSAAYIKRRRQKCPRSI
ncbi:pyrophosphate--fructose 6-phosphate 1-phosphotransferase subunit alpha [Tanacetum coccineum]